MDTPTPVIETKRAAFASASAAFILPRHIRSIAATSWITTKTANGGGPTFATLKDARKEAKAVTERLSREDGKVLQLGGTLKLSAASNSGQDARAAAAL